MSLLTRRKIEDNFCAYLQSLIPDMADKIFPTKGPVAKYDANGTLITIEPPYIVFACGSKTPSNAGAMDNNELSHFDATAMLILVTPSDGEFEAEFGPTSVWHDEHLQMIADALIARQQKCPIRDYEALLEISGFYNDGESSATERGRYGDIIKLQIFGKG